jgi:hypothetical protein
MGTHSAPGRDDLAARYWRLRMISEGVKLALWFVMEVIKERL